MNDKENVDSTIKNDEKQSKKIIIVSGNGNDLDISKVYNHLNIEQPDNVSNKKDTIVIPENKK